ncbi:MAG: hypothetical protein ABIE07_10515 [Candidatus Zixiibacteriota bacterium]
MKTSVLKFICISILIILWTSGFALAAKKGTIVLKNGETYENAEYKIDKVYKTVKVKLPDGETEKNFSFSNIDAIYDSDGKNLAPRLLGRWYVPKTEFTPESSSEIIDSVSSSEDTSDNSRQPETMPKNNRQNSNWLSEESDHYKHLTRRLWNAAFRFGGQYSVPLGSWFQGINSGPGFDITSMFSITHQIAIRFDFTKSGLNVSENYISFYSMDPSFSIVDQKTTMGVHRFYVSGVYYNRFDRNRLDGGTIFYAWSGLGAAVHKMSYEGTLVDNTTNEQFHDKIEDTISKFSLYNGVGFIFLLSKKVGIDVTASLDYIFIGTIESHSGYSDVQTAGIIDFKLGFVYFI